MSSEKLKHLIFQHLNISRFMWTHFCISIKAGRSWGQGRYHLHLSQPLKAPPVVHASHASPGLRFTLHLYRFIDTPRFTDWQGGVVRFTRDFAGFFVSSCKWSYKREGEECFYGDGDSEKKCLHCIFTALIARSHMLKERKIMLTQISSCCSDLHYWWRRLRYEMKSTVFSNAFGWLQESPNMSNMNPNPFAPFAFFHLNFFPWGSM